MSEPRKVVVHFRTENGMTGKVSGEVTDAGIVCKVPKFAKVIGIERNGVISPKVHVLSRKVGPGLVAAMIVDRKLQ